MRTSNILDSEGHGLTEQSCGENEIQQLLVLPLLSRLCSIQGCKKDSEIFMHIVAYLVYFYNTSKYYCTVCKMVYKYYCDQ